MGESCSPTRLLRNRAWSVRQGQLCSRCARGKALRAAAATPPVGACRRSLQTSTGRGPAIGSISDGRSRRRIELRSLSAKENPEITTASSEAKISSRKQSEKTSVSAAGSGCSIAGKLLAVPCPGASYKQPALRNQEKKNTIYGTFFPPDVKSFGTIPCSRPHPLSEKPATPQTQPQAPCA